MPSIRPGLVRPLVPGRISPSRHLRMSLVSLLVTRRIRIVSSLSSRSAHTPRIYRAATTSRNFPLLRIPLASIKPRPIIWPAHTSIQSSNIFIQARTLIVKLNPAPASTTRAVNGQSIRTRKSRRPSIQPRSTIRPDRPSIPRL